MDVLTELAVRNNMEAIARVLRQARVRRGWSHQELADKVGIAEKTIRRYEAGQPRSMARVLALCVALRIDLNKALIEDAEQEGRETAWR